MPAQDDARPGPRLTPKVRMATESGRSVSLISTDDVIAMMHALTAEVPVQIPMDLEIEGASQEAADLAQDVADSTAAQVLEHVRTRLTRSVQDWELALMKLVTQIHEQDRQDPGNA